MQDPLISTLHTLKTMLIFWCIAHVPTLPSQCRKHAAKLPPCAQLSTDGTLISARWGALFSSNTPYLVSQIHSVPEALCVRNTPSLQQDAFLCTLSVPETHSSCGRHHLFLQRCPSLSESSFLALSTPSFAPEKVSNFLSEACLYCGKSSHLHVRSAPKGALLGTRQYFQVWDDEDNNHQYYSDKKKSPESRDFHSRVWHLPKEYLIYIFSSLIQPAFLLSLQHSFNKSGQKHRCKKWAHPFSWGECHSLANW